MKRQISDSKLRISRKVISHDTSMTNKQLSWRAALGKSQIKETSLWRCIHLSSSRKDKNIFSIIDRYQNAAQSTIDNGMRWDVAKLLNLNLVYYAYHRYSTTITTRIEHENKRKYPNRESKEGTNKAARRLVIKKKEHEREREKERNKESEKKKKRL
jgi:hypothetical protein